MAAHNFTVSEALSYAWNTFKNNWQFLLIAYLIVIAAGMVPNLLHDMVFKDMPGIRFVVSIVGFLIQMVTSIGMIVISLKIVDGKKPEFADIYQHYPLILNYFLGSFLYGLIVAAGFILLIVPGIIWGIKYQYITYLVIDKKMSPMDALKKSGRMTNGVKMKLFYLGLMFMGLALLGLMTFGIGFIIVLPIISLAGAYVYRKLSSRD